MTPAQALFELAPGDVALGRLDVLPSLDGVEDGLWALGALAARGVVVLNGPGALLAAHDKLLTARVLRRSRLPHPHTQLFACARPGSALADPGRAKIPEGVRFAAAGALFASEPLAHGDRPAVSLRAPAVVKPRFGSWGRAVVRCDDDATLEAALRAARFEPWYVGHGALVQELVPPCGHDLRLVVAAGRVVGMVSRVAAPGEWRTNVALGALRHPVPSPPADACAIAVEAAGAIGAALVGVDLLPDGRGGWTVLELNGAVELTDDYAPHGDVFGELSFELVRLAFDRARGTGQDASAAVP
jgi:ribosomal protein S6--L-glutamate ligase